MKSEEIFSALCAKEGESQLIIRHPGQGQCGDDAYEVFFIEHVDRAGASLGMILSGDDVRRMVSVLGGEALARVEAEAGRLAEAGLAAHVKATDSQAQLAEAVGLLRKIDSEVWPEWDRHGSQAAALINVKAFLADYAQAEQQEAPQGWVPCSQDLLKSGVCCESAPRIAGRPGSGVSHYHPAPKQEAQGAQTGEFQREDRYIVIKRKDLEAASSKDRVNFLQELAMLEPHLPKREYLVIESDWPEYEPTWAAIQARVECGKRGNDHDQ